MEQTKPDSSSSTGAKDNIEIDCAVGGLGLIGVHAWLAMPRWIHRKRVANAEVDAMNQDDVAWFWELRAMTGKLAREPPHP